jgi:hypothetical protein
MPSLGNDFIFLKKCYLNLLVTNFTHEVGFEVEDKRLGMLEKSNL